MSSAGAVAAFRAARGDPSLVVIDGFHALKHAWRFGARPSLVVTVDRDHLATLVARLAPDVAPILDVATDMDADLFARLGARPHTTGVAAIATRPSDSAADLLADDGAAPIVLLEAPRGLGNVGACVRVAAAAGAAAVLTTGERDPWAPEAVRGSAGLHFALPVVRVRWPLAIERPLIAMDPDGDPFSASAIPPGAVIAFGNERGGLTDEVARSAQARLRLPMREGVSSLNLAASVSAVLYAWRLDQMK